MVLNYKGYTAEPVYSEEDKLFTGHLIGIQDLVNFHSETLETVETEFQNAVNDYLEFCKEIEKVPEIPKI